MPVSPPLETPQRERPSGAPPPWQGSGIVRPTTPSRAGRPLFPAGGRNQSSPGSVRMGLAGHAAGFGTALAGPGPRRGYASSS
jgi:hypothetical protein